MSALNPADGPSRGHYPSKRLLLPPVKLAEDVERFLVDAMEPPSATELRFAREHRYVPAAERIIEAAGRRAGAKEHFCDTRFKTEATTFEGPGWAD
ncbi:hypothetical protein C0993_008213 [Termitomyces sp. T159_Od127]|nr:hypothetical protein C0993_008213 [Termitomyces sp. T159_Od127]